MKRIILILSISLVGCARYSYERPVFAPMVVNGKTNVVVAGTEKTGIWSIGSKTGFKGITSDTKDGSFHRKVGVVGADTKGDAEFAEAIARGAAQGSGAGSLASLMQLLQAAQQPASKLPLNPGGTVHPEIQP